MCIYTLIILDFWFIIYWVVFYSRWKQFTSFLNFLCIFPRKYSKLDSCWIYWKAKKNFSRLSLWEIKYFFCVIFFFLLCVSMRKFLFFIFRIYFFSFIPNQHESFFIFMLPLLSAYNVFAHLTQNKYVNAINYPVRCCCFILLFFAFRYHAYYLLLVWIVCIYILHICIIFQIGNNLFFCFSTAKIGCSIVLFDYVKYSDYLLFMDTLKYLLQI